MAGLVVPASAASAASGPATAFGHLYNWKPGSQLLNYRLNKAKILRGTALSRLVLAVPGDSTGAGVGGNSGAPNYRPDASMSARLAKRLTTLGVPATFQSFASVGGDTTSDLRVSLVGAAQFVGVSMFGGNAFTAPNPASGVDFIPGGPQSYDRIDVYFIDQGAPFTVAIGGANVQTVTPSGASQNIVTTTLTVPVTPGTATINIRGLSSGDQYIQGLTCWNSTVPAIEIINGGVGGSVAANWTGTELYGNGQGLLAVKPKLALVNFGINEVWTYQTPAADYQNNIQTLVTNLQAIGSDAIIFQPTPIPAGAAMDHLTGDYLTALKAVADTKNVPLVMWCDRYQTREKTSAAGIQYDNLHPNGNLYDDQAAFLAQLLATA